MRVLASPSSTIRARYRHIEDGFPRSISSSRPVDISDQFGFLGNRARYDFIELDMSTGLDKQIDLGKPSSIRVYRSRYIKRFSAHRSLKISEQYFAIFFKGYISQTKLNSDAINYVACESLGKAQFYRDHVKEEL